MAAPIKKVKARNGIVRIPTSGSWIKVETMPGTKKEGLLVTQTDINVAEGSKSYPLPCDVCAFGPFRSKTTAANWFKRVLLSKTF